jgi:DNA helicase HerA-like ATPase
MFIHNFAILMSSEWQPVGDDGAWKVGDETITTFSQLCDLICSRVEDEMTRPEWAGAATGMGTVNAFIRRLRSAQRPLGHLIRADVKVRTDHQVRTSDAKVTVVDLHNLHDRAKRFVVGVTIRRTFDEKEASGSARPLLFLVLDELNKYAPAQGDSPIKEILLDVAERGRSLGIILIGAQQTASEVERRVIANSAIRVAGRLDPAEAQRAEYGFLSSTHRQRATIAKPGTMFVSQPEIPVPLVVEFPFPAWATRPTERGGPPPDLDPAAAGALPDDPLAGLAPAGGDRG